MSGAITALAAGLALVACSSPSAPAEVVPATWTASPGPTVCGDGWCWRSPTPQGNALVAGWALARDDAWLAGVGGTLLHWDGVGWTPVASGTRRTLRSVWGAARDDVWAVEETPPGGAQPGAGVLRWDGASWRRVDESFRAPSVVGGSGPHDVWVFEPGGIHRFDGARWSACQPGDPACSPATLTDVAAVWASSAANLWAVGRHTLRVSETAWRWDGAGWSGVATNASSGAAPGDDFNAAWSAGAGAAWLFGDAGIYRWDGTALSRASTRGAAAAWGSGPDDVWAAATGTSTQPAELLHWDGASWTGASPAPELVPSVLAGTARDDVWGASGPRIVHYDGAAWSSASTEAVHGSVRAAAHGPDDVWLAGGDRLAHWDGEALRSTAVPATLVDVWIGGSDVFAVGLGGAVLRRTGSSLYRLPRPSDVDLTSVWASGPDDLWTAGGLEVFHHDGTRWRTLEPFAGASAYGDFLVVKVWGTGPREVFVFGNFGSVARFDGTRWTVEREVGSGVVGVAGVAGDVWVVTDLRAAHWDGAQWTRHEGLPALQGVWRSGPSDVWAVGLRGAIVHWDGTSWSPRESGTTEDLLAVDGSAADDVWAVGSGGTILHGDGTSWSPAVAPVAARFGSTSASRQGGCLHQVLATARGDAWTLGGAGEVLHHAP